MSVRAVTDAGTEIDRVDLVRRAPADRPSGAATPSVWHHRASGLSVPGHIPL